MNCNKDLYSASTDLGSSPSSADSVLGERFPSSTGKPTMDWKYPDFEVLDLCMEVTAYIYHWQ